MKTGTRNWYGALSGTHLGAAIGCMMLGLVSARVLMGLLGVVLFISAIKTFQHAH